MTADPATAVLVWLKIRAYLHQYAGTSAEAPGSLKGEAIKRAIVADWSPEASEEVLQQFRSGPWLEAGPLGKAITAWRAAGMPVQGGGDMTTDPLQRLRDALADRDWTVQHDHGWVAILNDFGNVIVGVRRHHGECSVVSYDGFSIELELMALLLDAAP